MSTTSVHSVGDAAIATARRWAQACRAHPEPRAARLLAAALRHPEGLRFTLDFVDQVVRPEDPTVAAAALRELAHRDVGFLPAPLRLGLRTAVRAAPGALLPVVRRTFRALVGDLGTPFRSTYTAVGDCINFASRLEEAARELPAQVIVGPVANARLIKHETRSLGEYTLRGTQTAIEVFALGGQ